MYLFVGRFQEKAAGHGHRRHAEAAGEFAQLQRSAAGSARQCGGDRYTGRMADFQDPGAAGQHHQSLGLLGDGGLQVKGGFFRKPATGDEPAKIAIARRVFHQSYRPFAGGGIGQFGADDRVDSFSFASRQERPQAVEVVGVCQRQPSIAQPAGCRTDPPGRTRAPHQRVVGSDDQRYHDRFTPFGDRLTIAPDLR